MVSHSWRRFIYNELLLTATVTEMVAEYIQRRKTLLNNLVCRGPLLAGLRLLRVRGAE